MAQHTISRRLSRSFNVYLRCRGIRYDALPFATRHLHGRDDGTGSDDSIKKIKQDMEKLKGSSNSTALRIHRCGNAIEKQSQGKVVQPVAKSESHDWPRKSNNFQSTTETAPKQSSNVVRCQECKVSANSEPKNSSKECLKRPIDFEKIDLTKFEEICEESSQYIKDLLNGANSRPETINSNHSVNTGDSLSQNQGLRMPSHQDVQGLKTPLKSEGKDQKIDIQIHYKTKRPEDNLESSSSLNQAKNLDSQTKAKSEASTTSLEDKREDSYKRTFSDKMSPITSEFKNSFSQNISEEYYKAPQNEPTTYLRMNSDFSIINSRQSDSYQKEFENKPTVSLNDKVGPYVIPNVKDNVVHGEIDTKTSSHQVSDHVHDFDADSSKSDVSNEINTILKAHSAENKKRSNDISIESRLNDKVGPYVFPNVKDNVVHGEIDTKTSSHQVSDHVHDFDADSSKSDVSNEINTILKAHSAENKKRSNDISIESRLPPFGPPKVSENADFPEFPSKAADHGIDNWSSKQPLRGTVGLLLGKTSMDKETNKYGKDHESSGETPVTLTTDKPENFATKMDKKNPMIGTIDIDNMESRHNDDKSVHDSESYLKSNQLKTKKPMSSDKEYRIPIFENEFEKTIESQIIAEYSRNNSDKNTSASSPSSRINSVNPTFEVKKNNENQNTPEHSNLTFEEKYNPVDTIFEVKSTTPNNFNMYSKTTGPTQTPNKGTEISVTGNIIKSESDLTPGELYNSNPECGTNEHTLDNISPELKRPQLKIKRRNRIASKLGKRIKSQGVDKASKQKNVQPGDIGKSNSEIDEIHKRNSAETSQKNKVQLKTDLQPGNIGKSNSETDVLDKYNSAEYSQENKVPAWKNISNKSYFETRKNESQISESKADVSVLLHEGIAAENSTQKTEKRSNRTDVNVEETGKSKLEIGKLKEQNESESFNQKNSQNDLEIKAESSLTPGDLYNSKSEGDLYEEREFVRPKRKIRNTIEFNPEEEIAKIKRKAKNEIELNQEKEIARPKEKKENEIEFNPENYGDRFKLQKRSSSRDLKQKRTQGHTDEKSEVKKYHPKQLKEQDIEYPYNTRNESESKSKEFNKNVELKSEENLTQERRDSEVPQAHKHEQQEENLRHAKLYISKAKRLRDLAEKKSLERKKRLRKSQEKQSQRKSRKTEDSLKPTEKKMTLSEFLYGLVVKKDGNNKGGSNKRNFATYSALRCSISISHDWPLKYRKVHRFNTKFNASKPKSNDVFISPEVIKQGLGAEAILKERQEMEQKKIASELKANNESIPKNMESSKNHTKPSNDHIKMENTLPKSADDVSHTTIRGGSPQKQLHLKPINNSKSKDKNIEAQIKGGSQEGNERRRADQINQNNKRSYNTLSQQIWQGIRFRQKSLENKTEG